MAHIIKWEKNGLYRQFTGMVSGDEILESNFEIHVHPEFSDIKYIINDFLGVTEYSIKHSHTKAYAESDKIIAETKGKLNIAIVVNQDELLELANGYRQQMIDNKFKCHIFQTVAEARVWAEADSSD